MGQSEVLKKFSQLTEFQKEHINKEVDDYLALNKSLSEKNQLYALNAGSPIR